ncbi:MAG: NAD(P)/FAD-dependent oxidoreductase [Actinomycetales bacterium]|nr:NAD(P)/FAD-dependent oxidoreductase [Actinomycetales bacterium]
MTDEMQLAGAERFDDVIIGAGHNGLVAACYLALAGRDVCIVEAANIVGGAAISPQVFTGVDARLSKYSYLVSLLPDAIRTDLGVALPLVERSTASYTPDPQDPARGLLVPSVRSQAFTDHLSDFTGSTTEAGNWQAFQEQLLAMAQRVFPTLTKPLMGASAMQDLVGDAATWSDFFEQPLGRVLERTFSNDVVRGVVFTDALIGTYSHAHDASLRQNACFLYHVIGNGTGDWDLPVGGMGALTQALARRAEELGVQIHLQARAVEVISDGSTATVVVESIAGRRSLRCENVLANCAPAVLARLQGRQPAPTLPGAQIKVNLLLERLPELRDGSVDPQQAFSGTFHVNEGYTQLNAAFAAGGCGELPNPVPCETYCHTLGDRSILGPTLRDSAAQTLTVFALNTPHALFADGTIDQAAAVQAVLASINSVLAEPIEPLLMLDSDGRPCIDVSTTVDLEYSLGIPGGNIFHTPLDMPFAQSVAEIGSWGVETDLANVFICGAGARRGGGVSGIPGHNAAQAVLRGNSAH